MASYPRHMSPVLLLHGYQVGWIYGLEREGIRESRQRRRSEAVQTVRETTGS